MEESSAKGVTAGDKAQANADSCPWYSLLSLNGQGEFLEIMKRCNKTRDYTEIDNAIREKITPYLYNGGQGKWVPCSEIVHVRQCLRNGQPVQPSKNKVTSKPKPVSSNSKSSIKVGPLDIEAADIRNGNAVEASPVRQESSESEYKQENQRLVCWDIYKRGPVGETLIHICVLLANPLTITLAKRLLLIYPKMMIDTYLCDQYLGENILHIAIVNEDPAMVKFLLDRDDDGIIHKERAFGVFFSCDDQLDSRKDQPDVETLKMSEKTNYKGYIYWGEYPLSFAACLGQEECLRLLFAKGADPFAQDHNGNTILHMLVIHNKIEMFDLVLSMLSKLSNSQHQLLSVKNNKGLTPLTLAAAMAHQDMYNHLIEKEREVYWVYGDVTCAAYPLENIDTIGEHGEINPASALHLIIHGDQPSHLDMVDGMVVNLLNEKWSTFLRFRFYRRMFGFLLYFIIFVAALILRPGTDIYEGEPYTDSNGTNVTRGFHNCFLLGPPAGIPYTQTDYVRLTLETLTVIGVIIYMILAIRSLYYTGKQRFIEMLKSAPSLTAFYFSCTCVMLMIPGRAFCSLHRNVHIYEDILAIFAMLSTSLYFLFFCRGVKMVGPFVTMIYKMLVGDLLRFITIYLIFMTGFSQAMYIVHIDFKPTTPGMTTPFTRPDTAIMGMFYMSMGEFMSMYEALNGTTHSDMGKFIFLVYMVIVTLLLINMLIAMMGNTYTLVNETQKEWLRQWAHIVLAIEQSVTPDERLKQQKRYSQPMIDGRRALAIRWHQTEKEKQDLKKARDEVKIRQKEILMRHAQKTAGSKYSSKRHSRLSLPKIRTPSRPNE